MTGTRINFSPTTLAKQLCWIAVVMAPMDASLMLGFSLVPGFEISWSRFVLIVAVVITLLAAAITKRVIVGSRTWYSRILIIWMLWSLASIMWAVEPITALRSGFKLTVLLVVVWMSSVLHRARTADQAVLCILCISVLAGLVEEFTGYRPYASRQYEFAHVITGFYINPSHLGGTLALGFPWLMRRVTRESHRRTRLAYGLLCIVVVYIVIRTGTKGSLLGISVAGIASVFFAAYDVRILLRGASAIMISCLTGVIFISKGLIPPQVASMLRQLTSLFDPTAWYSGQGSFGSRWAVWQDGLMSVSRRPLIGFGVGSSEVVLGTMRAGQGIASAHNIWIQLLIEGGIIGCGIFTASYVGLVFSLIRKVRMQKDYESASTVLASLLASIPIGITVGNMMSLWMFWIILGIGLAEATESLRFPGQPSRDWVSL